MKDGRRLNQSLRMNEKVRAPSMADDEGYIWAGQNTSLLDEEPDVLTYYKLKVVPDEQ